MTNNFNIQTCKSLAQAFQENSDYAAQYVVWNPKAKLICNYVIPVSKLSLNSKCAAAKCLVNENHAVAINHKVGTEEYNDSENVLLCITCNTVLHIKCTGLFKLAEAKTPWMCFNCEKSPLNSVATSFFNTGNYDLEFDRRIEAVKREDDDDEDEKVEDEKAKDESEEDVTDYSFIDTTMHFDKSMNPMNMTKLFYDKFIAQREQAEKLKEMFLAAQQKIKELAVSNQGQASIATAAPKQSKSVVSSKKEVLEELSYSFKVLNANDMLSEKDNEMQSETGKGENRSNEQPSFITRQHASSNSTMNQNQSSSSSSVAERMLNDSARRLELTEIRKYLPKIEQFDGNPSKWLTFQLAVERNRREGAYSDELIKYHIRAALTGQALMRVEALFDISSPDEIMRFLKECFGDSTLVIEAARKRVMNIRLPKLLTHTAAMEATTNIASYLQACKYANVPSHDFTLAKHIHTQLDPMHQQMYFQFFVNKFPHQTRMERLEVQFEFLNNLAKTLPIGSFNQVSEKDRKTKAESYQLHSVTVPNNAEKSKGTKEDFKFSIRSKASAPYIGYDMDKVNSIGKRCEICQRLSHFTVECSEFRAMPMDKRYNFVKSKNLCNNCLLTSSHQAKDCDMKLGCGFSVDANSRCTQKHHIALHRGKSNNYQKQKRRAQSNNNQHKAQQLIYEHEHKNQQTTQVANVNTVQVPSPPTSHNSTNIVGAMSTKYNGYAVQPPKSFIGGISIENKVYKPNADNAAQLNVLELASSSKRTVKLFKIFFHGNKASAVGYAVGDSAAEITLIKKSLINDLGIVGEPCELQLQWTNNMCKSTEAVKVSIIIEGKFPESKRYELKEVYAVNDLDLPLRSLNVEELKRKFSHLKKIPFASYHQANPAMLIGSRHAYLVEALESFVGDQEGMPVGIRSKIGFTIYGGAPEIFKEPAMSYSSNNISVLEQSDAVEEELSNKQLDERYEFSCSIDSLGIEPAVQRLSKDERKAIELVEEEMKILDDGSIELPLIWNRKQKEIPKIPDNFALVYSRQVAQEKKLAKQPEMLKAFNDNFKELIDAGYVRPATEKDMLSAWPNVNYIPMSLVVNQNKQPVKTRNVYDASAKFKGVSLNDQLLMGPNLLVNILKPLMKMRMNSIAITADVKQMFHRIRICERDQQCQRILWRETTDEPMKVFIQQVMLFGPKSSPFASQIVKNKTAERFASQFPSAAEALKEYVYMDDLLTSEPSIEEALNVSHGCIKILKNIQWDLIGFQSNSTKLLNQLPSSNVKKEIIPIMKLDEEAYTTKVLGIAWKPKRDVFVFQLDRNAFIKLVDECGHKPTKRMQCSTIARIFDVIGFIAHCTIRGKILLQRSWRKKIDWDEDISDDDYDTWKNWLQDLKSVTKLEIPRQRFTNLSSLEDAESIELHTFSDAGVEAIAAVSYMVISMNEYRQSSFVMAKAKVAPLKLTSKAEISEMPRLELLGCVIGVRQANTISEMHPNLSMQKFYWTDSEIVLRWITNDNLKLPKHAISPIQEILSSSKPDEWHFVDSANNAADIATKFRPFDFSDSNSMWYQGPPFIKTPSEYWPKQKFRDEQNIAVLNVNIFDEKFNIETQLPNVNCPLATDYIIDLLPPSITDNWTKLVRAIARALKLYFEAIIPLLQHSPSLWNDKNTWLKIKGENDFNILTPSDIERAQLFIIRRMQRECYKIDYENLMKGRRVKNKELIENSVFMDKDGIIRIDSRVNLKAADYPQKFNPMVPRKSSLSRALFNSYHKKFNHCCIEAQIAEYRAHYWSSSVRAELQCAKERCNRCIWLKANPQPPKMAPLPNCRIDTALKPFQVTGLDCAGPFEAYKTNGSKLKIWILIFTCTLTRFIHLHILDSMDTTHVLEAIVMVYTIHGPISQLISDNGTNFVGAAKIIHRDQARSIEKLKECNDVKQVELAEKYMLKWSFIPVQSPWFGAFYERLIKEVKRAISSSIEGKKVKRIEFNIALHEAAHRINCRPLTHNSISHKDEEVLTPHHLAKNRSGWPLLPSIHNTKESPDPKNDKSLYHRGRNLADDMMRRFTSYYLPVLTRRTKWFKDVKPIKIDDLVLLVDPNKTRKAWDRARVIKVYRARDGRIRVADVVLADGTIKKNRSVQRLAKLDLCTA